MTEVDHKTTHFFGRLGFGLHGTLAALVAAFLVSACDGAPEREAKYLKRAEGLLAAGQVNKATLEFRNVLQINPTNVRARFQLGVIEEGRGNFRQAFSAFNQVITQEPKHVGANVRLAQFYLSAGDLDEAEKRLKIAAGQAPDNPLLQAVMGALYLRRGQIVEGITQAQAALKNEPTNLQAIFVLVQAYQTQKRFDDASAVLETALQKLPKSVELLLRRASLNVERNERDLVERDFAAVFEIAPTEPSYRLVLARLYILWKRPAAAELALRDAIRIAPKDDALKRLLVTFLRKERTFGEAEKSLKELIGSAPSSHVYLFGLASLYVEHDAAAKAKSIYNEIIQSGADKTRVAMARNALARLKLAERDISGAREQIDLALKADANNEDASLLLGKMEFDAGKYEFVIAKMRELVRHNPKSVNGLRLLAEAYVQTRRLDLAGDTLGIATSVAPKNDQVRVRLAAIYVLQERHDAAFEIVSKIATGSEAYPEALRLKSEILVRTRRFKEASQAADALIERSPEKARAYALKGHVLLQAQDYRGALSAFEKSLELRVGTPNPDIVTGMVASLIALKELENAERRLKQYQQKEPERAYLYNLLGEVYSLQRNVELAEKEFKKAADLEPRWSVPYINRANLLLSRNKVEDAIAVLNEGAQKSSASHLMQFALGIAYHRAGKIDDAIAAYERLLKESPNVAAAANNLAVLLADFRHDDKASLDKALALTDRFKEATNPAFLDTRGWVHYRRGEFAEAIRYLERSVQVSPEKAEYRYHLGMAYLKTDQQTRAKAEFERATAGSVTYHGLEDAKSALARLIVEAAK